MNKNKKIIYNDKPDFLSIPGFIKNPISSGLLCLGSLFLVISAMMIIQPRLIGKLFGLFSIYIEPDMIMTLFVLLLLASIFIFVLAAAFSDLYNFLGLTFMKAKLINYEFFEISSDRNSSSLARITTWHVYIICRYTFNDQVYEVRPIVNTPKFYLEDEIKEFFFEHCIDSDNNVNIWLNHRKPHEPISGLAPNFIISLIVYSTVMAFIIFLMMFLFYKTSF